MIDYLKSLFSSTFFDKVVLGNPLEDWLISLIIIIISFSLSRFIKWIIKTIVGAMVKRTESKCDDLIVNRIQTPIVFSFIISGCKISLSLLTFSESIDLALSKIFIVLATLNVTWFICGLISGLLDGMVRPRIQADGGKSNNQVFGMVRKIVVGLVWIFGIVTALNNSGYDVGALIAGLGIGGIAMAMAAQNTVANFFGGFTVLLDRPFSVGQRIRISGYDGVVESIGMRTFRLRTLAGTLVTIPNSQITGSVIENVTLEPTRKITLSLGLTYNTTADKMEEAMSILKQIAKDNAHVSDNPDVFFESYGDFALGITFIYYIVKDASIFETQSEINLEILRRFSDAGLEFAFPSQTIYVEKSI